MQLLTYLTYFCTSKASKLSILCETRTMRPEAGCVVYLSTCLVLRQYLYSCTSKASKLSIWCDDAEAGWVQLLTCLVCFTSTSVLVKQVN